MRNNSFVNNNDFKEVLTMLLIAIFIIYFQTYFILNLSSPFSAIDLITITIIFLAIEYDILPVLITSIVAGLLCDALAIFHSGFYLFYFVFALFMAKLINKFFVLKNLFSKFLSFLVIYLLKYIFVFTLLIHQSIPFHYYLYTVSKQFFISIVFFFVIAKSLSLFLDILFVKHLFRK